MKDQTAKRIGVALVALSIAVMGYGLKEFVYEGYIGLSCFMTVGILVMIILLTGLATEEPEPPNDIYDNIGMD